MAKRSRSPSPSPKPNLLQDDESTQAVKKPRVRIDASVGWLYHCVGFSDPSVDLEHWYYMLDPTTTPHAEILHRAIVATNGEDRDVLNDLFAYLTDEIDLDEVHGLDAAVHEMLVPTVAERGFWIGKTGPKADKVEGRILPNAARTTFCYFTIEF
jgi:hypothetical protein